MELDQIGVWAMERKQSDDGALCCRVLIPAGQPCFFANVHLKAAGDLVVPDPGVAPSKTDAMVMVRQAFQRC